MLASRTYHLVLAPPWPVHLLVYFPQGTDRHRDLVDQHFLQAASWLIKIVHCNKLNYYKVRNLLLCANFGQTNVFLARV